MKTKDFLSFEYLKNGNPIQKEAFNYIWELKIPDILQAYSPTLAGTIPINISTGKSDLDILCCVGNHKDFQKVVTKNYGHLNSFEIKFTTKRNEPTSIARFKHKKFPIEIFAQNIKIEEQFAFLHMVKEYKLLNKYGKGFAQKIIELKKQGIKTEPAFAKLLNLNGDPYEALLKLKI